MPFTLHGPNGTAERQPKHPHFIHSHLAVGEDARGYYAGAELAELYPDRAILETNACAFDVRAYADAGQCVLTPHPQLHAQFLHEWDGHTQAIERRIVNGWFQVDWQGRTLDLLLLYESTACQDYTAWIIATDIALAEEFFRAVCAWSSTVHDEVLVFEDGYWRKSDELFSAIRAATWDTLIMPAALKQQIRDDLTNFFTARETYTRYGVPWKRGVVLIGPPGNGKTHAVKALVNMLGKPCLYVKSIDADRSHEHGNIRKVFERARNTAPCVLVLEDLDTLVTAENRSVILNELDGFAGNDGILTLATTNYPERLDPAILDRPSRFDRKYHFDLPAFAEREAFIADWNTRLGDELRLSPQGISAAAAATEGFSFAYLKELMISATMAWMNQPHTAGLDEVLPMQVQLLRSQMVTGQESGVRSQESGVRS
jgi:hypothetical protein